MNVIASEIRGNARLDLKGHWTEAVLLYFVYLVIVSVFSVAVCSAVDLIVPGVGSLSALLLLPMEWGVDIAFLNLHRGEADPFNLRSLITGYEDFGRVFLTLLLMQVYVILWTLLLVVPGIIKALSYSMTPYILKDYPELSCNQAIEKSMAMMKGHKGELFYLYLTFLGWAILCVLTFGIGCLWLGAYTNQALANFYETLKAEQDSF